MLFTEKTIKKYLETRTHIKEENIIKVNLNDDSEPTLDLLSLDYGTTWIVFKLGRLYGVLQAKKNISYLRLEMLEKPANGGYSFGVNIDLCTLKNTVLKLDRRFINFDFTNLENISKIAWYSGLSSSLLKSVIFTIY